MVDPLATRLVLCGFMGSGKSHVGRLLASDLGIPFLDTDQLIEWEAGRSIREIFEDEGEAGFRERERAAVRTAASLPQAVIATGGGTMLDEANREVLRPDATWITLDASVDEIMQRVGDRRQRPLLQVERPEEKVKQMLADREPIYALSDHRIDTTGMTPRQVADALMRQFGWSRRHHAPRKQEVVVQLPGRSYTITIAPGLFEQALPPLGIAKQALTVLIGPPLVLALYARSLQKSLRRAGYTSAVIALPDGEEAKNLDVAKMLYDRLVELGADRSTCLLALGGGVCGDLVGFVAATYQRGIPFVQVPTTLLAQVDASVGGKVAVNHPAGKNLIGAFYQPKAVLIDPRSVRSLPWREYRQGLAEVAKYGVLVGDPFFSYLEEHTNELLTRRLSVLTETIQRSCEIKAKIVSEDETDQGQRMLLNLGHTFAHALETLCGYGRLAHGEAVSIGMRLAADLAHVRGHLDDTERERIIRLLTKLDLPIQTAPLAAMPSADAMLAQFQHDKKTTQKRLRFILPMGIGDVRIVDDVTESELRSVLKQTD